MSGTITLLRRHTGQQGLVFRKLDGLLERLRGLLGTNEKAEPVALVGCSSIHTFGMRYRIDVAFVGSSGMVLKVVRSVPPNRVLQDRRAWVTLERPHVRGPWLMRGEMVAIRMEERNAS